MALRKKTRQLRTYLSSAWHGKMHAAMFDDVENYCMFIGYPRTGHSLIGSLLDAHSNMIIAHELDALDYIGRGYSRNQLFHLIVNNSRQFSAKGRTWTGYSYQVSNQWQGRSSHLRVIGDKMAARSARRLSDDPGLIGRLRHTVGMPLRLVHVIRNPYDVIATMTRRGRHTSSDLSIEVFFRMCRRSVEIKEQVPQGELYDIRLEDFINAPTAELKRLCAFLGIDAEPSYLEDCASIVFKSPKKSRFDIPWSADAIERVRTRISDFEFLAGYSFHEAVSETDDCRASRGLEYPSDNA